MITHSCRAAGFATLLVMNLLMQNLPLSAAEASAAGLWQKIEDGKPAVWVLFVEHQGTYEGAIAKTFPDSKEDAGEICNKCNDDRKNAPLLGISLIRDMKRDGLRYEGGNILDPRDGSVYKAKMSVSPDGQELTLRGYVGFSLLGKNEVWYRLSATEIQKVDVVVVSKYLPELLIPSHPSATAKQGAQRSVNPTKATPTK